MYVCVRMFCNKLFFLLCAHGTLWATYRAAFPEKVRPCRGLIRTVGSFGSGREGTFITARGNP